MNIIISNRFSSLLKGLNIEVIKELNGEFEVDDIINQLTNIYYDRLIIDISAIKNNQDIATIQKLSGSFDMSKVILLLDETRYFSTQEFISSIISIGIYNFTKNIDGVKYLIDRPNSYGDVMKYHKVEKVSETKTVEVPKYVPPKKYTTVEEIYASNSLTPAEKEEMITKIRMQETIKQAKMGGEYSNYVRKKNLTFKILLTVLILPLMALLLTYGYFYLLYTLDGYVKPKTAVGNVFYFHIFENGPTVATLLALLITIIVARILFGIINTKIKSSKGSCLKFSLIPFGVFVGIVSFDKYIVTFLDNVIKLDGLEYKPYMNMSIYFDFKLIATLMVLVYYSGLLLRKFRTLEFEQEIGMKTTIFEKLFSILLVLTVLIPGLHYIFNLYTGIPAITDFFNNLFKTENLMLIITIIEIIGVVALIVFEIINSVRVRKMKNSTKKVIE